MEMATFDPNKMAVFRGDEDEASPTTIIFKQMQAQGIPLNAGNIQKFMQQYRAGPASPAGQPDIIQGGSDMKRPAELTIERGSDDSAPAQPSRVSAPGPDTNRGAVDTRSGDQRVAAESPRVADTRSGDQRSSAQPTSATDLPIDPMSGATAVGAQGADTSLGPGGKTGLAALILGGAQLLPGLIDRGISAVRGSASPLVPSGPAVTPDAGPQIRLPGPQAPLQLGGPQAPHMADPNAAIAMPPPTPMQSAMDKAVAPQVSLGSQVQTNAPLPGAPAPEVPFRSAPNSRVPQADITVRPRIPLNRVPRFSIR